MHIHTVSSGYVIYQFYKNFEQISAVIDGSRDAGLCTLKSDQLLHETQLSQTECAMLHITMNRQMRRPSKLSDQCMAAWRVDHPGVTNRS